MCEHVGTGTGSTFWQEAKWALRVILRGPTLFHLPPPPLPSPPPDMEMYRRAVDEIYGRAKGRADEWPVRWI